MKSSEEFMTNLVSLDWKHGNHKKSADEVDPFATQIGIYDEFGVNLREKVVNRLLLHHELAEMEKFKFRGALKLDMDASDNVDGLLEMDKDLLFAAPQFQQMIIQQGIDVPFSQKDIVSANAYIVTRNGMGIGNATFGYKRQFSKISSGLLSCTVRPYSTRTPNQISNVSLKGERAISRNSKGGLELVYREGETGLNLEVTRTLSEYSSGTLTYGFGCESGVSVHVNRQRQFRAQLRETNKNSENRRQRDHYVHDDDQKVGDMLFSNGTAGLQIGPDGFGVDASWLRAFTGKSRGKVGVRLHTSALELELSTARTIAAHTNANMALSIGIRGISLKFRYQRGTVRFVVPILLSSQPATAVAMIGGIIPLTLNYTIRRVLRPYYKRRKTRTWIQQHQDLKEERDRAFSQLGMMKRGSELNQRREGKDNGLIILKSRYGTNLGDSCLWSEEVYAPTEMPQYVNENPLSMKNMTWSSVFGWFKMEWNTLTNFGKRSRAASDWDDVDEEEDEDEESTKWRMNFRPHPSNIDTTEQLNFFVKDSTLYLPNSSKSNLLGFYDPCYGLRFEEPELFVRYSFAGQVFELTVTDTEPLRLPSPRAVHVGSLDSSVNWRER